MCNIIVFCTCMLPIVMMCILMFVPKEIMFSPISELFSKKKNSIIKVEHEIIKKNIIEKEQIEKLSNELIKHSIDHSIGLNGIITIL